MSELIKKLAVILFLSFILIFSHTNWITYAKEPSAIDCLDNNIDCEEENNLDAGVVDEKDPLLDQAETSNSLVLDLVKMFFFLLLILGLIYFLLKYLGKRTKLYRQASILENLGGISVGQNKSIQIIRVDQKVYLVGVGNNVELLQEIDDESVIERMLSENKNEISTALLPEKLLNKFTKRNQNQTVKETDFKQTLETKLAKMKNERTKIIRDHQKDDQNE